MKKLIVTEKNDGKKLNTYLLNNIEGLTYSLFSNTLRKKDIKINGKRINKDIQIHTGDEIQIYISDDLLNQKAQNTEITKNIETIYEDEQILILNKPQGIEVTGQKSLTTYIHNKYQKAKFKPMPCHRLDRNTYGLIIYAKTQEALEIMLQKFKNHEIEKHYHAWVYNIPQEEQKEITAYLFKDTKKARVYISDKPEKGYQKIITSYKVIKKNKQNNTCILDVQIQTGKTHQIRAHLAHIGLPIIGDGKYGKNEINKKFKKKTQCLCAYKLKFNFTTPSKELSYLNKKTITIKNKDNATI